MDFFVVLSRPGFRVAHKKRAGAKVGFQHKIGKEDAVNWFKTTYDGIVIGGKK